jgi:hypothetical protein
MPGPQPPASVERATLAGLEATAQQALNYVKGCPLGAPPGVMIGWITNLDQYAWAFQQFAPVADWLKRQGFPEAQRRLSVTLRDLSNARSIYVQMYQGMLKTPVVIDKIWKDANNVAAANVLASTNYSNAVFAKWQQDMFDIMEQRCYDCKRIIGIPAGGYCWECARKRGWVH